MARSPAAKHYCPLYERETNWTECYEVQEVREDEMDKKWLRELFNMKKANVVCEKCRWYVVKDNE